MKKLIILLLFPVIGYSQTITSLSPATTPTGTEVLPVDQSGTTKKLTVQQIVDLITKTSLGLSNVDNTSDASKPVSTATTTQLNLKAPLASPALTGTPTAPTATPATNTTQIATTAYADAIGALKANLFSPTLTGTPLTPTAAPGTNTTQIASTAFVTAAVTAGGGITAFTGLSDVPNSYSGQGSKVVRVNAAANALEFFTLSAGSGDALVANPLSQFASTSSSQFAGVISDETGTGAVVLAASPTLTGTPAAPTASAGTSTTQIASTAYVQGELTATWSTWTPTFGGTSTFSANPTGTFRYLIDTRRKIIYLQVSATGTSNAANNTWTMTLPSGVTAANFADPQSIIGQSVSNNTGGTGMVLTTAASNVLTIYASPIGSTAWGAASVKGIRFNGFIEIQ